MKKLFALVICISVIFLSYGLKRNNKVIAHKPIVEYSDHMTSDNNKYKSGISGCQSKKYICNIKTHKFHLPSCIYLPDENNRTFASSRSDVVSHGYFPCQKCNP